MASGFPGSIDSFTNPLSNSALNSPSHAGQHQDLNDAVNKVETYMGLVKVIPTSATNGTVSADGDVTIGNAVSSVTVSGAFSALYDSYRVVVVGATFSTSNNAVAVRLGSSTTRTDYFWGGFNVTLSTGVLASESANGTAEGLRIGYTTTNATSFSFDIHGPFLAIRTNYNATGFGEGNYVGNHSGYDNTATSYSDLVFRPGSGTVTGGTIRVYGYRN